MAANLVLVGLVLPLLFATRGDAVSVSRSATAAATEEAAPRLVRRAASAAEDELNLGAADRRLHLSKEDAATAAGELHMMESDDSASLAQERAMEAQDQADLNARKSGQSTEEEDDEDFTDGSVARKAYRTNGDSCIPTGAPTCANDGECCAAGGGCYRIYDTSCKPLLTINTLELNITTSSTATWCLETIPKCKRHRARIDAYVRAVSIGLP